jgi:hypothetical protein
VVEALDPLQPGQHRARFLHSATVTASGIRICGRFGPRL